MSRKLYIKKDDDEKCYTIGQLFDFMRERNIQQLTVYRAKVDYNCGAFYCQYRQECGDKNGECNAGYCDDYVAKNGTKGRCKYYSYPYEATGEIKILTLK